MIRADLYPLDNTLPRDPDIDAWLHQQCGDDVHGLIHDAYADIKSRAGNS